MAAMRRGSSAWAEAEMVSTTEVGEGVSSQTPPNARVPRGAVVGIPTTALDSAYTCVGLPIAEEEHLLGQHTPGARMHSDQLHGHVSCGVGDDFAGATAAARESARRDNAAFQERKRTTETLANARVEAEERAFQIARLNAKRRDSEGLDMQPHPGNRLEASSFFSSSDVKSAFDSGGNGRTSREKTAVTKAGAGATENKGRAGETPFSSGGYQCAEYQPAEYECTEYKSVYDLTK